MSVMTMQPVSLSFSGPRSGRGRSVSDSVTKDFQHKVRTSTNTPPRARMPRGQSYGPLYNRRSTGKEPTHIDDGNSRGKRQRSASSGQTARRTPLPVQQDVTMDHAPTLPLSDVVNCPSPTADNPTRFEDLRVPRAVLQPLLLATSTCPPGLPVPPIHRPLPTATWHRMGISTSEYMFLLKRINPHTTHVMSQFNPDRRFLHPAFLEPPPSYNLHKVPAYRRTPTKWDQIRGKWEASGKHQKRGDWFGLDKTWIPCSEREPLCEQWRNSRCDTCTSSFRSLHNRVLVAQAVEREEESRRRSGEGRPQLDPVYCYDADMRSPAATLLAHELKSSQFLSTEDGSSTATFGAGLEPELIVCPPTPRPQSFDDFDDESEGSEAPALY